jgi:hypothetical protein
MKLRLALSAFAAAVVFAATTPAQAPAGAPNGSTGKCGDGTYTSAASKSGACSAHKGVGAYWGAAKPMPAPAAKPAMETAPPSAKATPGGGPGMVWVNTDSKVYHCAGSRYYGKTKSGKYVSEAAAKGEGDRPDAGKPCMK